MNIQLLGTSACHLCSDAESIVNNVLNDNNNPLLNYHYKLVDIMDDDQLFEEYHLVIPTLLIQKGMSVIKMNWPFTYEQVVDALHHT